MNAFSRNALRIETPAVGPAPITLASLIPDRARALGCMTFESYCDLIDKEATAHLTGGPLARVSRLRQYRRPRPFSDCGTGKHCLSVPLNSTGTMYAKVDAADWFEMQELGVRGLWTATNVGGGRIHAYTEYPMKNHAVTVARLILGLGAGQQVSFADGDSLNLRRSNLLTTEQRERRAGSRRRARYDAREVAREAAALRDQMVAEGRRFDVTS